MYAGVPKTIPADVSCAAGRACARPVAEPMSTFASPKSMILDVVALREERVLRLDVAVDDALVVHRRERVRHLPRDAQGAGRRDGPLVEHRRERRPLDVLQHEEVRPVVELAEVDRGGHVRVLHVRSGDRLALEAIDQPRQPLGVGVQELDGDALAQVDLLAGEHRAHAALAEDLVHAVPAQISVPTSVAVRACEASDAGPSSSRKPLSSWMDPSSRRGACRTVGTSLWIRP